MKGGEKIVALTAYNYATAGLVIRGEPGAPEGTPNLTGLQAGLGLEFSASKSIAFDLEAKTTRWMNIDPMHDENPSALQLGGAVMFHF